MATQAGGPKKVLIVGGVAGGASCAARLRRMDEKVRGSWSTELGEVVIASLSIKMWSSAG